VKIYTSEECPQKSAEWMLLRSGIPTASEMDALLTPLFKLKEGKGPRTYLCQKTAEWWQGCALPSYQSFQMEQGNVLEEEALPWYNFTYDANVKQIGFVTTDDGKAGCSPDGICDEYGVEIKCPQADTHTRYLLDGTLPDDYQVQVHFSMFITGMKLWKFISFRRGFPQFVLDVPRDEAKQQAIRQALTKFNADFDYAKKAMEALNGGPKIRTMTPMPKKDYILKPTTNLHEIGVTP